MGNREKTVVLPNARFGGETAFLEVRYPSVDGSVQTVRFTQRLVVGRDPACDLVLLDQGISRRHLEIYPAAEGWWARDLGSSNGTYLNGRRIQQSLLPADATIHFFEHGPDLQLSWKPSRPVGSPSAPFPPTSPHTPQIARQHRRRFTVGMYGMSILLAAALGMIYHQYQQQSEVRSLASELFYQTKMVELELSRLKQELAEHPGSRVPAAVQETSRRLQEMQSRYSGLSEEIKLIGSHRSREDLLIFRIARVFGEYDMSIPDDFIQEVKRYIRKWQQGKRLEKAMSRIHSNGWGNQVAKAMGKHDLPPQFLYLAIQESDFRTDAIGPVTRFGIPKGMWQFLPQTAAEYGLKLGPASGERVYDPRDERFDFQKSTKAAAEYLQFLYTTEAQGSGLLVMSAYNWGQENLRQRLVQLPQNPVDRNFWRLLKSQWIPDETYSYVLGIVAAAVIGEDPQYFGFSFANPLADMANAAAGIEPPLTGISQNDRP